MISNDDVNKLKKVFATKDDLKTSNIRLEVKLNEKIESTKQELLDRIDEKYSKIFNLVDGLAGEIRDSRESRAIFSYRIEELEKKVSTQ
jgi:tetrahydromethanopterin S-methyltransferase subunit G